MQIFGLRNVIVLQIFWVNPKRAKVIQLNYHYAETRPQQNMVVRVTDSSECG